MFDPDAHLPKLNRSLIYLAACVIAGLRLARERQVNVRVIPTGAAIEELVDLAHEIFNRVFRKLPERWREDELGARPLAGSRMWVNAWELKQFRRIAIALEGDGLAS